MHMSHMRTHTQHYVRSVSQWLTNIAQYLRKLREHSVATALAKRVFPVPGAP